MADVNRTVGIIFTGQDNGAFAAATTLTEKIDALGLRGLKAADALAAVAAAEKQMADAAAKATKDVDDLGKATEGASKSAVGVGSAYSDLQRVLAVLGVAAITKDLFDANIQFERTSLTLKAITGDSASAGKEFDFVRGVAARLGLEIGAAADQYSKLIAASKGTQLEGEPTRRIFEQVAGAMATLGKSSSDTGGVLNALTQIISKGKVQAEELTGQVGDRLPGALQIAARAMGTTTDELLDLVKAGKVGAEDFLPKFAAELGKTFGTGSIDTYGANLARFKSSLDNFYVTVGQTGIVEAAGERLRTLATGFDNAGVQVTAFAGSTKALYGLLSGSISFEQYAASVEKFNREAQQANAVLDLGLNQSLAETNRLVAKNKELVDAETAAFVAQSEVAPALVEQYNKKEAERKIAIEATAAALKTLGVDPKKFQNDFDAIAAALDSLFRSSEKTGEQAFAGFEAALKRVRTNDDLNVIGGKLTDAFVRGDLSAKDFDLSVAALVKTQEKLSKGVKDSSDSIDKQAKAAERAKEKADDYRLKMEQLASNERIKNIEATVTLKVANVEADAKRVIAAFESINNTVNDTGKQIGDLFGLFKDPNLTFRQLSLIKEQIDKENQRRDDALKLQRELTEAEIEKTRAQTKAIDKGDSLIKIDGAGLQPHLEAFMYEILRTIQVRVNQDGLKLLLGT